MIGPDIMKLMRKMLDPVWTSIRLSISRCVLESIKDDEGIQVVKVSLLANEVKEMERFQQYGFTSTPDGEAEGVCVFIGGNREHGICIALDDRDFRLKSLGKGHVALYDKSGTMIHLKANGKISIEAATEIAFGKTALEKVFKSETFQAAYNQHQHIDGMGITITPPVVQSDPTHLNALVKTGEA